MTDCLYNLFFYANTCHVCKCIGYETSLRKCSNCKMISYCGKEHQKEHWLQHKHLCRILSAMLRETNKSNLLEGMQNFSMNEWANAKMNLMLLVSLKLNRKLLTYEKEMFMFPKACAVCHETNSQLITDCLLCPCASFCKEHQKNSFHANICKEFCLSYKLDISSTTSIRYPSLSAVPYHTEITYLPFSMEDFMNLYINDYESISISKDVQIPQLSEYFTRPLTLLYAIERLKYQTGRTMNIHIIGANMIEFKGVENFEILLHWIPSLITLNITLIGPEIDSNHDKFECCICDHCIDKGMKLYVEVHSLLYKDYIISNYFTKPDIIIGYNLGIHECENVGSPNDTWSKSIELLPEQKCPFVLTSYTDEEIRKDYKRLCDILNRQLTYFYCEKNRFSSLRPRRDYENESVFYQNQYIMIYNDLN